MPERESAARSLRGAAAVRPDAGRRIVPLPRTYGYQGSWIICSGHNHGRQLVVQPGNSRRCVSRNHAGRPGRTSARRGLQHQEDEHGAAGFLCAHPRDAVQRKPDCGKSGGRSGSHLQRAGSARTDPRRATQRVSRRVSAGFWAARGGGRGLLVEVHAQRVRLRRFVQHADHLSNQLAQFQNQRLFGAHQRAELSWFDGVCDHERRERAVLQSASGGIGNGFHDGGSFPNRPRPEVSIDDAYSIPAEEKHAVDWLQLALRQWPGGGSCARGGRSGRRSDGGPNRYHRGSANPGRFGLRNTSADTDRTADHLRFFAVSIDTHHLARSGQGG